jgi:DNA-binding transcriptional MerR regulator
MGDVADKLQTSTRTIKYFEESGLIEPRKRSPKGLHALCGSRCRTLEADLKDERMGFSLIAVREVLGLRSVAEETDPFVVFESREAPTRAGARSEREGPTDARAAGGR